MPELPYGYSPQFLPDLGGDDPISEIEALQQPKYFFVSPQPTRGKNRSHCRCECNTRNIRKGDGKSWYGKKNSYYL